MNEAFRSAGGIRPMRHPARRAWLLLVLCASLCACSGQQQPQPQAVALPAPPAPKRLEAYAPASPDRPAADPSAHPASLSLHRAPACSYLSADEVSGILKGPIRRPSEKETDGTSSCSYPPLDPTSNQQAQIDIAWQGAGEPTLEDKMAGAFGGSALGRQVAHRVTLGDGSTYSREGVLRIRAAGALISITLLMRPDAEDKAVALGTLLLARMGFGGAGADGTVAQAENGSAVPATNPQNAALPRELKVGDECPAADPGAQAANLRAQQDEQNALVPLKVGLTLAETWTGGVGNEDHECLFQVIKVTDSYVDATLSCIRSDGQHTNRRRLCRQDLRSGHFFHPANWDGAPPVISPASQFSLSAESLHELKTRGKTRHHWLQLFPDWATRKSPLKVDVDATLVADPAAARTYGILLNDKFVQLPVVVSNSQRAQENADEDDGGTLVDRLQAMMLADAAPNEDADGTGINAITAVTLDDERFPLMLDYQVPGRKFRMRYTKITYAAEEEMETRLAAQEPVTVYGIYFDFASDKLRPESTPVLDEIAAILRKNPEWKLSVTGHTDSVGGNASNLDLSKRRAAAVKTALIDTYHVAASRLTTDGSGAGAPQDTNETPEGRARNRRVVLRRVP